MDKIIACMPDLAAKFALATGYLWKAQSKKSFWHRSMLKKRIKQIDE